MRSLAKPKGSPVVLCLRTTGAALALLLASASRLPADPTESPKSDAEAPAAAAIDIVDLTLLPAAEPRPALRYRLMPRVIEQHPGNAAAMYYRAMAPELAYKPGDGKATDGESANPSLDTVHEWLAAPPEKMPLDDVRRLLHRHSGALTQVELGANRESCDWGLPLRDVDNVFAILLPTLGPSRHLGSLIALQARCQIAQQQPDAAVATLRMGIAFGRRVGEERTMVSALVGTAIVRGMLEQVEALVQAPDAPNLYWALTSLPRPLVDIRPAVRLERDVIYLLLPEFRGIAEKSYTPRQWEAFLLLHQQRIIEVARQVSPLLGKPQPEVIEMAAMRLIAQQAAPECRDHLVEIGFAKKKVDAMPDTQVVAIHTFSVYDELYDQMLKWTYIPYAEAAPRMEEVERSWKREGYAREVFPLAANLLAPLRKCVEAPVKLDRQLAALRCVEAIRLYAAAHDNKLPVSLAEIDEVPIPLNPVTGKSFPYGVEGDAALLTLEGRSDETPIKQYRIRMAPPPETRQPKE